MRIYIFFFFVILNSQVFACVIPPETFLQDSSELVSRSSNIALAKVTNTQANENSLYNSFTFRTEEIIKGEIPDNFILEGRLVPNNEYSSGGFSEHQDPEFWAFNTGNGRIDTDCSIYGLFELGTTYLIFYDLPANIRSFEKVSSDDDIWLNVVKLLVERIGFMETL